jgi:DNA-binding response OmpR family regulator
MADYSDSARILIVDDEPASVRRLARMLGAAGYRCLHSATDPREALALYRAMQPDLVLVDLGAPHAEGIAVLEQLAAEVAPGDYVPMLVLTADVTFETKWRALSAGASDFLARPFEQIDVVVRASNLLRTRRLHRALHGTDGVLDPRESP